MPARAASISVLVLALAAAAPVAAIELPTISSAPAEPFPYFAERPFPDQVACEQLAEQPTPAAAHLCEQVMRAWDNATGAHAGTDDPLRVNFAASGERGFGPPTAVLPAAFLSRLLAIPHLLPPRLAGGLVLENVLIDDTLRLVEAQVSVPVTFRHTWFTPQTAELHGEGVQFIAFDAERTSFEGALQFIGATIVGHVRIADSRFAEGLHFGETVVSTRTSAHGTLQAGFASDAPAVGIRGSTIGATLTIGDSLIFGAGTSFRLEYSEVGSGVRLLGSFMEDDVRVEHSRVGSVRLEQVDVAGNLIVEHNRAGQIVIKDAMFRDTPYVNANVVEGGVELVGMKLRLKPDDFDPEAAANDVGGHMWFMPDALDNARRMDLTYNRVGQLATVFPPDPWQGTLDLSNSKVESRLELDRFDEADSLRVNGALDGGCAERGVEPKVLVNLTNVETDVLVWNFPLNCLVQWDGAGLQYRYWGDPDRKPLWRTEDDFVAALVEWRNALHEPSAGPLSFMADYLHERGQFSGSRQLLREAKATNYAPLPDDAAVPAMGKWLVYAMLWPTGFGAQPEFALLWLFGGWLLGTLIYATYHYRAAAAGWPPPEEPEPASDEHQLGEAGASFEHEDVSAAAGSSRSVEQPPPEQPSLVPGFMQYQRDKRPADFSLAVFSADALLPVINLHAYTEYYPRSHALRFLTFVQHVAGWYLLTIFLASATVL